MALKPDEIKRETAESRAAELYSDQRHLQWASQELTEYEATTRAKPLSGEGEEGPQRITTASTAVEKKSAPSTGKDKSKAGRTANIEELKRKLKNTTPGSPEEKKLRDQIKRLEDDLRPGDELERTNGETQSARHSPEDAGSNAAEEFKEYYDMAALILPGATRLARLRAAREFAEIARNR